MRLMHRLSGCPVGLGLAESTAEGDANTSTAVALWSTVAKRHRPHSAATLGRPKPRLNRPQQREKRSGIVGTGPGSSIRTVKTKMVSVFATRFAPELEADTLSLYLQKKLGREATCTKIDSSQSRYSSFKVVAECDDVKDMYDPALWPEGAFVRHYYEVRKPKAIVAFGDAKMNAPLI